MVEYTYAITDFLNNAVDQCCFIAEVEASAIGVKPSTVWQLDDGSQVFVQFGSAVDEPTLAGVVAAHEGLPLPEKPLFHASSKMVEREYDVTQTDWEDVGGAVTNPAFFMADTLKAMARVVGDAQTNGTVDARVLMGDSTVMGTFQVGDTSSAWDRFSYTTDPGQSYPNEESLFRLQMKLGTATTAKVRYVSMTMLELQP